MKHHLVPGPNPLPQSTPHATSKNQSVSLQECLRRLAPVFLLSAITFLLVFMWLLLPSVNLKADGQYLYVASTGADNPACSISAPCQTIQYAVNVASANDEIRVAAGTYAEGVIINKNLTLRGGFSTSDWFANPVPETNRTIINAQGLARTIEVPASGAIVTITGFDLTGGTGTGGGGAYNLGTLTLENNRIYGNANIGGANGGGGVSSEGGTLILKRNLIYSNTSTLVGGGIGIGSGNAVIEANKIFSNTATTAGGGINISDGNVALKSNLIYTNTSNDFGGGGLLVAGGTVSLENNTFFANAATKQGGGIRVYSGTVAITNSLIVSNTAANGGGIYKRDAATLEPLAYTDFFGNSPNQVEYQTGGAQPPAGTNRTQNPLFTTPTSFDLHLLPSSPAIDTGAITSSATIDFEGEGRPFGAGMDRGGDEYLPASDCYARISGGQVYTNAQAALNAASAGATVQIAGRCTATGNQVLYISQTLTIRGGYTRTNWAEPIFGPTVLDATGAAQGVYILGNSNIAPTLDGFHITGATDAGVVVNGVARPVVQNNVIYSNGGNGITHGNGASTLQHNTIYGNDKNGLENSGGQMIIANNLVISNTGRGISGTINLNTVYANDVFGNSGGNYGGAQTDPGSNGNLSVEPGLVNLAGGNFHLNFSSPVIGRANADYVPALDMDGDTRPQGQYADIGADEVTAYAEAIFSPATQKHVVDQNTTTVYTHTLTNNGTQADTFNISFSHSTTWTASVQPTGAIVLAVGEERVVTATLIVPADAASGQEDVLVITATSTSAPNMFATATDTSLVRITPGAVFVPQYRQPADPGKTITLTHILTNTGTYTDSFGIELGFPLSNLTGDSWGVLLPSAPYTEATPSGIYTYTLGKNQSMAVQVQVSVPISAEAGLENVFYLIATSQVDQTPEPNYSVRLTDTIIANAISGDRYVNPGGNDYINNCVDSAAPCATIKRGVQTVSVGNTVFATTGLYPENNIQINGVITVTGGCASDYSTCIAHPGKTIIDGQGADRILWILSGSDPTIQGFTIQNGKASAPGAGLYIEGSASPVIQGNQFFSNTTSTGGGGIAVEIGNPVIKNNVFFNNSANAGGGIHVGGGDATLINNTFISNTAGANGGGIYNAGGTSLVSNTIFAGNVATGNSGAVYNQTGATTPMDYNNFYHNSAPANANSNAPTGSHSLALEPGLADVAALDFHLVITSSMIDVADLNTSNDTDYEKDLRPVDQGYDMGADEFAGCLAQVASTGAIYGSAQNAIDVAESEGDTVRIHGTCRGVHPLTLGGQVVYQTVHLTKEVALSGGWNATFKEREPYATFDAEGLGRALLITGTISPAIERLIFTNGSAVGLGGGPAGEDAGGAVYNFAGDPSFKDVILQYSQADLGGGMYNHSGAPAFTASVLDSLGRIINSSVSTNTATTGGGFYNYTGDPVFAYTSFAVNQAQNGGGFYNKTGAPFFAGVGNQFRANQVTQNGGGFYNETGALGINSARIYLNVAGGNGGGVYNSSSQVVTMTNLAVYSNKAVNGAGFYNYSGNPRIWNATAVINSATGNGGAFYNRLGAPELINSILFNNRAASGGGVYAEFTPPTLRYNDVFSNTGSNYTNVTATGAGSISTDPLFLDDAFHLSPDSPAMDAADPDTWVTTDFDAEARPGNQGYDMGADEINACFVIINEDTATIYGSVQQALDNSLNATDVIKVSGHCLGTSSFEGGAVTAQVYVDKSRTIQGGWNQTFTTLDPAVYSTTLDALDQGHVIYIPSGVQPIIENLHIVHGNGGAVYNTSQYTVTLRANKIHDNTSGTNGAGIYNAGDKLLVEGGNRIYNNTTTGNGGAFYSGSGTPIVQNNFIYTNTAAYGGGIYIGGGSAIIRHNTLDENRATTGAGAGIYRFAGSPDIRNNIVVGGSGTGMASGGGSGTANYNLVTPASGVYSNTHGIGNLTGANDIHTAPTFTETARVSRDYHLIWGGAGPDQGDPALFGELLVDFESDMRPSHQGMDIGADEIGGCYARINEEPPYYGSAQYAVKLAQAGDIVDVAGTCLGVNSTGGNPQNLYINKAVTLRGGWEWDDTNKAFGARTGVTNLDPENLGRGIYLAAGNGTVDRFRIYNSLGGAVYNAGTATLVQNNVLFNNAATGNGAGIYNASGNLRVWHNTIISNTATGTGGAMYVAAGRPDIYNNIFGNNTANGGGSAVYVMAGATPNLDYNNTWNNTYGGVSAGSHDVNGDPEFKSLDPTNPNFVKLPLGSPVIDKGYNQANPVNPVNDDFEGQPRPSNLGFDMGADEYAACLAKIVSTEEIFGHIQDAVDVAQDNDTILVAGVCEIKTEDDQTVLLAKPLTLRGGYDENFDTVEPPLSVLKGTNATGHTGRVVVVESGADVIIESFNIVNGNDVDGAGVYNAGKLDLVGPINVAHNTATGNGGGIYNATGGELTVADGSAYYGYIKFNTAGGNGGGIYNAGKLSGSGWEGVSNNNAANGAGLYNNGGQVDFENSIFEENVATQNGGGIYSLGGGELTLTNIFVNANEAGQNGGGYYIDGVNPSIYHNTVRDNSAVGVGGALYNTNGTVTISNTIIYANRAATYGDIYNTNTSLGQYAYTDFYDNAPATIMSDAVRSLYDWDPMLDEYPGYTPDIHSRVIDAGDPDTHVKEDCCDNDRPRNQGYDLGMVEVEITRSLTLQHVAPPTPDSTVLQTQYADPGTTVTFTHILTNNSLLTDTFDIIITNSTQSTWVISLTTPASVILPSKGFTTVLVSVSVPTGTLANVTDNTQLQVSSQQAQADYTFDNTVNPDPATVPSTVIVTDRTIVKTLVDFQINNNEGYGAPGQTLTYTHLITNAGNITDTLSVFMDPQYAEMHVVAPTGTIYMPVGATATLTVSVTLPAWEAGGIEDTGYVILRPASYPTYETAGANTTHISYTTGTRYVSTDGNDGDNNIGNKEKAVKWNNCTDPLKPACRTLAHALEQASPGDLIKVAGGTYSQTVTQTVGSNVITQVLFIDKSVAIEGGYTTLNWDTSQPLSHTTLIDPQGMGRGAYITGTAVVTLDGLKFTNGLADEGAAIYNAATLTLQAATVASNTAPEPATNSAGAVYNTGRLAMRNTLLISNKRYAIYQTGSGQALVEFNTFFGNGGVAEDGFDSGAIRSDTTASGALTVTNNIFQDHQGGGGPIQIDGTSPYSIATNIFYSSHTSGVTGDDARTVNPLLDLNNLDKDELRLQPGSPAENAAVSLNPPAEDFERDIRPQKGGYDIGADEQLYPPVVIIAPDRSGTVNTGGTITYTHTITNAGPETDVITLTASSSRNGTNGWTANFTQVPPIVTLTAGQTQPITVVITAGSSGTGGQVDRTVITATSSLGFASLGRAVYDIATDVTTVTQNAALQFAPNRSGSAASPGVVTYTHTLTNTGNGQDSFTFSAASSRGWAVTLPPAMALNSLASGPVVLTLTVPAGMGGFTDTTILTATSAASSAVRAAVVNTTTVPVIANLQFAPSYSQTDAPGTTVNYELTLTNTGNTTDTFNLVVTSGWTATLVSTPVTLAAGQSAPVYNLIQIPLTAITGTTGRAVVTATSTISPALSRTVVNTTTVVSTTATGQAPEHINFTDGITTGLTGTGYTLVALVSPSNTSTPITYTWQATDLGVRSSSRSNITANEEYTWPTAGVKTILITATNGFGTVTNTRRITITVPAGNSPITAVTINGPASGAVGSYVFTATVAPSSAALPITYTWQADGNDPVAQTVSAISHTLPFTWNTTGAKVITVTADNGLAQRVATHTITIVQPLSGVSISGPTNGLSALTYVFTATATPSSATTPITYTWQADGNTPVAHTGNTTNPVQFSWNTGGVKVITVTANNGATPRVATHTITIAIPPAGVEIAGPNSVVTSTVQRYYTATVSPADANTPVTYTWQATGKAPVTHANINALVDSIPFVWDTAGVKVITVTASNGYGPPVVDTHTVTVTTSGQTPTGVTITGPITGLVNNTYAFTATVGPAGATQPITYTWQADENGSIIQSNNLSDVASFTWTLNGVKTITVTANNGYGVVTDVHTITISTPPEDIHLPQSVAISGPTAGVINTGYAFTATVSPLTTTLPITYVWQATGYTAIVRANIGAVTNSIPFTWTTAGVKVITVTANNGYGITVTDTHTVVITAPVTTYAPQSVTISGPVTGQANAVQNFSATVSPANTSLPLTYIWQADSLAPVTHTNIYTVTDANLFSWPTTGAKVVTVTASNAYGTVIDTHTIVISGTTPPVAPGSVTISGPVTGQANAVQNFTATVSPAQASQPITYTWQADGLPTVIHPNVYAATDVNPFSWPTTGTKVVTVTATNASGTVIDTHTITITSATTPPVLPQQVDISGPITGTVNGAGTFIATVSPANTSQPITYTWQADGLAPVIHANTYTTTDAIPFSWPTAGAKVITVTAANRFGAVIATHIITIESATTPPVSPQQVVISGLSTGLTTTPYSFTATVSPVDASRPITYYWQATDYPTPIVVSADSLQNIRPYTWATTGAKVITVTAANIAGTVNATHTITISAPQAPTGVTVTGPITALTGLSYPFTATVSPPAVTLPLTYTWQTSGQAPVITTSANVFFTWNTPGVQVITVTVSNAYGSVINTFTVTVSVPTYAPAGVVISGRTTGYTATTYNFMATVTPPTTTRPITYIWQATGQSPVTIAATQTLTSTVRYAWPTTGTKVITVTANNGYGTVTDVHTITLNQRPAPTTIYLPLTMRDYSPPPPPDGPDVIVTGIVYDQATGIATVSVRNQGNRTAEHWFFVDLYIDRQPTDLSDLSDYYGYSPYHGLAAGASANVVISGTVTIPAGSHQLYAQADVIDGTWGLPPDGQVSETDETNNVFGPVNLTVSRANRTEEEPVGLIPGSERAGHPEATR